MVSRRPIPVGLCGEEDCPRPYEFCEACIRAAEGERIAQAIEVLWDTFEDYENARRALEESIRIARNGGSA